MDQSDQLLDVLLDLPDNAVSDWLGTHCGELSLDTLNDLKSRAEKVGYGGDLNGALGILTRAEQVATAVDDPLAMGPVWRGRANVLQRHERFEESLDASGRAAVLYEQHGTPFDVAVARTVEVYILGALERFDEAISLAMWIRPHFADFPLGLAFVTSNLAQVYTWAWRHEEALETYRQAYDLYLQLDMTAQAAQVLHNMGVAADQMGQLALARSYYERAYPDLVATSDVFMMVKTQFNLALLCLRKDQHEDALAHLAQARFDLADLPHSPDLAYVDLFEARVRRALGQSHQARSLLEQALSVFRCLGRNVEAAETLLELGLLLATDDTNEGRVQGLTYLDEAETLLKGLGVPLLVSWIQLMQGELLFQIGDTVEAVARAELAHTAFAEADLSLRQAQAGILLADCRWRLAPREARRRYETALEAVGETVPSLAARCWHGLGRLSASEGDIQAAERAYERAIALFETVRRSLHGHRHQSGFLEGKLILFEELLAALQSHPGREGHVLVWTERLKAAALADLLVGQPPDESTSVNLTGLLTEREHLRQELDRRMSALIDESGVQIAETPQRGPALAAHDAYQAQGLLDIRRQLQILDEQIARSRDQVFEWREGLTFDPSRIHTLLGDETALISYYVAQGRLHALTATSAEGDLAVHPLDVTLEDIDRRWQQSRRWVVRPSSQAQNARARLGYLWDVLIAPLVARLRGKSDIVILPYRELFHIPFAGLYDRSKEQYLVERWSVQLAPSATVLAWCQRRKPGTAKPLVVGYPGTADTTGYLPGVEREIQSLTDVFDDAETLYGEMATVRNVMSVASGRSIVHLAGHAFYNNAVPLESGMPLAGGRWLRAADLYQQSGHLDGATVVLSSCSAGRGRTTGGDVLGLISAFLYAGARGVVAGLWRVDDAATVELMAAFYRAIVDGLDTQRALRKAQCTLLRGETYAHPYFWASFELSGAKYGLV